MTGKRRNRADVLGAAFKLLDSGGLEAVTLNAIARELGAHLNTVSFQVKTKARLFELMADEVLGELTLDELPEQAATRIRVILDRYRGALLSHRDGARLVAGTEAVERNTLRVADAIIGALLSAGAAPIEAVRISWGLHYFLLGLVEEEQSASPETASRVAHHAFGGAYPALAAVGAQLLDEPFDARFSFGVEAFLSEIGHGRVCDSRWEQSPDVDNEAVANLAVAPERSR